MQKPKTLPSGSLLQIEVRQGVLVLLFKKWAVCRMKSSLKEIQNSFHPQKGIAMNLLTVPWITSGTTWCIYLPSNYSSQIDPTDPLDHSLKKFWFSLLSILPKEKGVDFLHSRT